MKPNEKMNIGKSTIWYDKFGNPTISVFTPAEVSIGHDLVEEELYKTKGSFDKDVILRNAEAVMAMFVKQTEELGTLDLTKYQIVSEEEICEEHESGMIKRCTMNFFVKPLND